MTERERNPFPIAGGGRAGGGVVVGGNGSGTVLELVDQMVRSSDVFLFIKGTPARPMCGFSANTVAIMDAMGVRYETFDVLSSSEIRAAAKEYAGWPTFPQLYVRGEFVGGNDILSEMYANGELNGLLAGVER